jgi:hypothetical protein
VVVRNRTSNAECLTGGPGAGETEIGTDQSPTRDFVFGAGDENRTRTVSLGIVDSWLRAELTAWSERSLVAPADPCCLGPMAR